MAIPTPIIAVPTKSMAKVFITRAATPASINNKATNKVRSNPCFLARVAAIGDTTAKAMSGNVVKKPACDALSPK